MQSENQKLVAWILKITVGTLASICITAVVVLLVALFHEDVSNEDIFAIIGPAFNTVIGAFVGLLGGLSLSDQFKGSRRYDQKDQDDDP